MTREISICPIYGITDGNLMPGATLFEKVESALKGGVKWIQYRNKLPANNKRLTEASELLALCKSYSAILIINDDVELTANINAHGVHLGQDDMAIENARAYLGSNTLIGATCHNSIDLALAAQKQGADYLAFGRFFPSRTKSTAPKANLKTLELANKLCDLPIVAIGGLTLDNASSILSSGAHSLAICDGLFNVDDVEFRAKQLLSLQRTK